MQVHVLKVKPFPVRRSLSTPAGAERVWLAVSKQSSSMHACSKEVRSPANLTVTLRVSIRHCMAPRAICAGLGLVIYVYTLHYSLFRLHA